MPTYSDTTLELTFIELLKSHHINKAGKYFAYKDLAEWEAGMTMQAALDKYGDLIFFYEDEGYFEFDADDNAVLTAKGEAYLTERE